MLVDYRASLMALVAFYHVVAAGHKSPRASWNATGGYNASTLVSFNILTKTGIKNATAPYLYGWMFEDINHSGDGGLYGELLTNRAFDGSNITWGIIPGFADSSIVYQENACEAYGEDTKFSTPQFLISYRP
jgi:alpha-N-arabinofuranosidase